MTTAKGDVVTWCFGHLYEQASPEDYNVDLRQWRIEDLPILPEQWQLKPKSDTRKQIGVIASLFKKAFLVINAGDPDREGQLLVDDVIEQLEYRGHVERIWLKDLTDSGVQKALQEMKSNSDPLYAGLSKSAKARGRADWLIGMNLTRVCTVVGRDKGHNGVLSVGRVQTPTLALVVQRDDIIDNFQSIPFFGVQVEWTAGFVSHWKPGENIADSEGRCLDKATAQKVMGKVDGKLGKVQELERKSVKAKAPLPYSLSELQGDASKRFSMSAQKVLDVAQSLYEKHKLTSYPRTDCGYLAQGQHADAPDILQAVASLGEDYKKLIGNADTKRQSSAFNDKKVTAHTGIVPTGATAKLNSLSKDELQLFDIIVRRYIAQFYDDAEFDVARVTISIEGEIFITSGKVVLQEGWRVCFVKDAKDGEEITLPNVAKGDSVTCVKATLNEKKTTPPARFTEGSLIKAMAKIASYVSSEKLKAALKENSGIGTEATRASMIETLKKRGFIATKGKTIISTASGRAFVQSLPENLTSAEMTALWELWLEKVADGSLSMEDFMAKQIGFVKGLVDEVKDGVKFSKSIQSGQPDCRKCKGSKLKQITAKNGGKRYWVCASGRETCDAIYPDKKGQPDFTAKKKKASSGKPPKRGAG